MMVGTYRQHLACVAAQLNGVKRHRSMKPSNRDPQLGLASPLNYPANKSGKIKIKNPSKKEAGAGCKSPALASREGTGETFSLDILFHRMSVIGAPLDRVDGQLKVTGTAKYSAEFEIPNLAYAEIVTSTVARARIVNLETRQAELVPGVIAVLKP